MTARVTERDRSGRALGRLRGRLPPAGRNGMGGIGRAAVLIGVITALARVLGFGRQLVFAHTVGTTCLGTAYATANQVPNIVYDIVLGGALTSVVVPVLARPAERAAADPGAAAETRQIASALLTWTLAVLVPVSAVAALAARPVVSALLAGSSGCGRAAIAAVSSRMLAVFAPQIALYGLAVVMYGILQAHRRFTAPAVAPVLSSLVVAAAYLAFVPLGGAYRGDLARLPGGAGLMLSAGTTAGVAALVLTAAGPLRRLRLGLRPALRFPRGVAARARGLAAVGVATLIAQDLSVVAVTVLANGHGGAGAIVLYGYGWQVFLVPYAVLAVPIATSAFPLLSSRAGEAGERSRGEFDDTSAGSTRAVVAVSFLGAAMLAGAAIPVSRVFVSHDSALAGQLAWALAAFAPGLAGYGIGANMFRVLLALGRTRIAAGAMVAGWLLVIAADVAVVPLVHRAWVVPALGLGNTAGLIASGAALLAAVRRYRGRPALRGVTRAVLAGLAGALAGAAAGAGVSAGVRVTGFAPNAAVALLACGAAAAAFAAVAMLAGGGELRAVAGRLRGGLAKGRP